MNLFDTHAHLDSDQLVEQTPELLADAKANSVGRILTVSTTLASCYRSLKLAEQHSMVYAAVGIHPCSCHQANLAQWKEITTLINRPKVVAIGETGLDGYWDDCPMETQLEYFLRHIELSHASGLPFIVHMRDCETRMMETLESALDDSGQLNGVMHSFCGSKQAAQQCLDWGMYISFGGMVTFKKNDDLRAIAASIPDDRILIETDAPFLSPHPHRSQRPNTPALIKHTLRCIADARGTPADEFAKSTTENALRLFRIDSIDD